MFYFSFAVRGKDNTKKYANTQKFFGANFDSQKERKTTKHTQGFFLPLSDLISSCSFFF